LRIACRTAEWQSISFEDSLKGLFGDDDVRVFELCPLCRPDAEYAAEQNGIDPSHLMKEVARSDVEAFASKPVTLNFLLELFKKNNEFPNTQTELYLQGCLELCSDTEKRKESRRTGALDPEQRLILAARIAAMMMFGNRSRVWIGKHTLDAEEQDVTIRELCGEMESRDGELFAANGAAIREVLEYTGLFSSGGGGRLRWRHQTYAEFLAALYLDKRNFTLTKKLDLILHFGDPEKKVVPQLHETAAWLAGMDNLVFEEILKTDPEVLLRSDVAKADAKDRERLVAALLKLYHEDERPTAWFTFPLLRRLSHPALAKQLRPYITDDSKWITARGLAIQIAHACETKELQDVLANLALHPSAPLELRCDAIDAVGAIGDHEIKLRLKPLAVDDPSDHYKQLKGHALMVLWPSCLTSEELFDSITYVTPEFYGAYDHFISDLAEGLHSAANVFAALRWLEKQPHREFSSSSMNKLKDAIVVLGWNNVDMPGAADLFARIALAKLMSHEILIEGRSPWDDITGKRPPPALGKLIRVDDRKRRIVLSAMIDILSEYVASEEGKDKFGAFSSSNPFLIGGDLGWFIEQCENADSQHERLVLLHLISWVFHQWDVDHIDTLLAAVQRNDLIAASFGNLFREIRLDSE
jgi:predicted NACHT family NTPase